MSRGLPIDLSKVSAADVFPEGRFRVRVQRAEVWPKDKDLGQEGEIPGELNDEGKQRYGALNVGYKFTEHATNYVPDPKTGEPKPLAGRFISEMISFHPSFVRHVRELYDNTATDPKLPPVELVGKELDIVIKNKARRDDPEGPKESTISRRALPVG